MPASATHLMEQAHELADQGQVEQAVALAVSLRTHSRVGADAYLLLAQVARAAGRHDESLRLMREATLLRPGSAVIHTGLGGVLRGLGRFDDACFAHRLALALAPGLAQARINLGNVLVDLARPADAMMNFVGAIACDPSQPTAWYALGNRMQAAFRLNEAGGFFRRALALAPEMVEALSGLGKVLRAQGEARAATIYHQRAVERDPGSAKTGIVLLNTILYDSSQTNGEIFRLHRQWAERHETPLIERRTPHANTRNPDRRLRLGYMSADFHDHPVARNMLPLIARHDHTQFEVFCYADDARRDATTDRFEKSCDVWRSTLGLADEAVAEGIRRDGIDILVCLAGHTLDNRPMVPAFKPAPVQVSMHDLTSSGLRAMDYWISDRDLHPRHTTESFTERIVRLPMFYLHDPPHGLPRIGPRPARESGWITFGSFNNPAKIGPEVIRLWASVLRAVPNSRLLLQYLAQFADPLERARMHHVFAAVGVPADRIQFGPGDAPRSHHLDLYNLVDIALDTYPFNGSTTTFEALSMGVPVVSLTGDRFLSRVGLSMLRAVGLEGLAVDDEDAYVRVAIALAVDERRRDRLRQTLRSHLAASPLCDVAGRARQFERTLRAMWRSWCLKPNNS